MKRTEKCYTFKELEKQFEVSQPTTASILARLDQRNMVVTSRGEKDKHIRKAEISDEGRTLISRLGEHLDDSEHAIMRDFTENEQEMFRLLLERAYYNIVKRGDGNN